jgi:hypothetical protein
VGGWRLAILFSVCWFISETSLSSAWRSATYDEPLHLVGGWSYWKLADYRLHPTNGALMQSWLTLPYAVQNPTLPATDSADFRKATKLGEDYGKRFLFQANDEPQRLLGLGRFMTALVGLFLAGLAWTCARWLFPLATGTLTAILVALCPNIIAHAGLATSDVGAAFGFLLAIFCWARLLERITPIRVFWSVFSWGILAGIKMSAVLILPIAVIAATPTVLGTRAWRFRIGEGAGWARTRSIKVIMLGVLLALHLAGSALMVWSSYGFRYSAFASYEPGLDDFTTSWPKVLERLGTSGRMIQMARDNHLLPEAYLYGFAHTLKHSQKRPAYLNGRYSATGWWYYFPLVFLMKTPLPTLGLFLLAGWWGLRRIASPAAVRQRAVRERMFRRAWPLVVLIAVYFLVACSSNLNIGYRHLLPILPPLFVLVGGLELARPAVRVVAWLLVVWLAVENVATRPYYLSYFNQLAGGRENGYRRLSDSNIDWGQDLPSFAAWIRNLRATGDVSPIYFTYFGVDDPKRFGIDVPEPLAVKRPTLDGWYCFSVTMFTAPSRYRPLWGDLEERQYQEMLALPSEAIASSEDLQKRLLIAKQLRLTAGLAKRKPDEIIGGSILAFKVTDEEAKRRLFGPPPHR